MNSQDILRALKDGTLSLEEAKTRLGAGNPGRLHAGPPKAANAARGAAGGESGEPSGGNGTLRPRMSDAREAIAVVGMSGRYPEAGDLQTFWDNLRVGRCSVREVPESRWNVGDYYAPLPPKEGSIYCKWLGALDDIDAFDPLFFHISPSEAELMDPQQRIFLQEAYSAFADAGYTPQVLNGKSCGVYLGLMGNEYYRMLCERQADVTDITGNNASIASARISYFLNLKGPALTIDTACSSSLVAIHTACQALRHREVDMALAGGVTLYLTPESYMGMCAAGMLAADGRCKTFDQAADGMVPGEGAGAVVLKRLADAEADGDWIYGLIIGSGTNQDGKTNGITAPSIKSQLELQRTVYRQNGIDPATISYAEMHGTGTKLGDPIELKALSSAFREHTDSRGFCAIGSVKTNIGHTSAAAGVAGLQKVLLCMQHGQLVPTLHFSQANEHFSFEDSPFYVNTQCKAWESASPRRSCVSSFGFSGTNAHVVVEEYVPAHKRDATPLPDAGHPVLMVLSAKSDKQLRRYAQRLKNRLCLSPELQLADVAYTLQTGREAMEYRLAFPAGSREEAIEALQAFACGDPVADGLAGHAPKRRGPAPAGEGDALAALAPDRRPDRDALMGTAERWIAGGEIDWTRLYAGGKPRRIPLPGYPFANERYWIPGHRPGAPFGAPRPNESRHPLLHRNSSDLSVQRFSSELSGREPFLTDHVIAGRRLLPGSAYLEMARAALAAAAPPATAKALQAGSLRIRLTDHVWTAPLAVEDQPVQVHIELTAGEGGTIAYTVHSGPADAGSETSVTHCLGNLAFAAADEAPRLDVEALLAKYAWREFDGAELYRYFDAAGFAYGPAHRGVERLYCRPDRIVAKVSLSAEALAHDKLCELAPGLLDSALQASAGFALLASEPLNELPFSLQALELWRPCPPSFWVRIQPAGAQGPGASVRQLDIDLCGEDGSLCARLRGFATRALSGGSSAGLADAASDDELFYLKLSEKIWNGELSEQEAERLFLASR